MKNLKSSILSILFLLVFSLSAGAQNFFFVPYEGAHEFIELPQEGQYREFLNHVDQELLLGRMELHDVTNLDAPIEVHLKISSSKQWHLRFFIDDEMIGYLYFSVRNDEGKFWGMLIDDHYRKVGLSKFFLKYYVLFCRHYGLEPGAAKIYKPLMARVLMRMGFVPRKHGYPVWLQNGEGQTVQVYPVGFELRAHLIESQHMRVLQAPPPEADSFLVYLHTRFAPPTDPTERAAFWQRFEELGGEFYLYQNPNLIGPEEAAEDVRANNTHLLQPPDQAGQGEVVAPFVLGPTSE